MGAHRFVLFISLKAYLKLKKMLSTVVLSLTSIMMPDSVSKIGINAFKNCSNLKQITSNKQDLFDEHQFDDIDNIEFLNHLH